MTENLGKENPEGDFTHLGGLLSLWKDGLEFSGEDLKFSIHLCLRVFGHVSRPDPLVTSRDACGLAGGSQPLTRTQTKGQAFAVGSEALCQAGFRFIFNSQKLH